MYQSIMVQIWLFIVHYRYSTFVGTCNLGLTLRTTVVQVVLVILYYIFGLLLPKVILEVYSSLGRWHGVWLR